MANFFIKLKEITNVFIFDSNNYDCFPKESFIDSEFGNLHLEEYVRQTRDYVYSFRKYKFKDRVYYYSNFWPKINWDVFLKRYRLLNKMKCGKREIFILNFKKE